MVMRFFIEIQVSIRLDESTVGHIIPKYNLLGDSESGSQMSLLVLEFCVKNFLVSILSSS